MSNLRAKVGASLEHYDNWVKATDRWTSRNKFYDTEITTPSKRYKSDESEPTGGKMAKRSRSRPANRRRRVSKRTRRSRSVRRGVPRTLTTQSKVISCKLTNYVNLTGTGTMDHEVIQLNSCDDPFAAGGNGQPLGYDQWKALYKRAIVLSSKVTVQYHNRGTTAVMCGLWPAPINQGTTPLADYETLMEVAGSQMRLLSPEMDHMIMTAARSTKKHLQINNVRDNEEIVMYLDTETPPTKQAYWHLNAQAADQASAYAVDAIVTVRYIVLLFDPIIPARSVDT